ncbi:type II toxin-antitoxin system RnlA family toxin [bacterium]|nr:type II toxin-antitoxin system RnlA family toxin [bacterium]
MVQINLRIEDILKVFEEYCNKKKYQINCTKDSNNNLRLEISNIREKTLVIIYRTGSIVMGGKNNKLKAEFEKLSQELLSSPQEFVSHKVKEIKACATRYEIVTPEIRRKIREALGTLEGTVEITEKPKPTTEYIAKVTRNSSSSTITQFSNGTLLVQGKTDKLFDDGCTWIEKIANPSDKEVIARFISSDEKSLQEFSAKYTPQLIEVAESSVEKKIGNLYKYLESYDRKWFVASECLCLSKVPLPEFSPIVMPASKAFEGFAKKLLVDIGLFDKGYFQTKDANFSTLNDVNNPKRKAICNKEQHAHSMLKRLNVCLDTNRNFMMHSDDSKVTKVNSIEEGEEKVNTIFKDAKEIFGYFHDLYKLL